MSAAIVIVAVGMALMGLAALVKPAVIWAPFGVEPTTPASRSEVRAVYGGFGLAIAGVLVFAAEAGAGIREGILLTVAVSLFGMAAGRVVSALFEPRTLLGASGLFLVIEVVAGELLLLAR
jgi:hypothetical protein